MITTSIQRNFIICIICSLFTIAFTNAQKSYYKEVGDFYEVKVFNRIEVTLKKSDKNAVQIIGSKKDEVVINNNNGVLKIKMNLEHIWDPSNTEVILFYKDIRVLDANEGAIIRCKNRIEEDYLTVKVQEGAKIFVEVQTEKLDAKSVTGGEIQIRGEAKEQKVVVQAGGQYLCKYLKTQNTDVKISAGGFADIYASKFVKANTTAGGVIEIYGNPEEIDQKKVLGGKIIEKN